MRRTPPVLFFIVALVCLSKPMFAKEPSSVLAQRLGALGLIDAQKLAPSLFVSLGTRARTMRPARHSTGRFGSATCNGMPRGCWRAPRAALRERRERRPASPCRLPPAARRSAPNVVFGRGNVQAAVRRQPKYRLLHNYGLAVDITLANTDGTELDMGTPVHYFGDLAQPRYEHRFSAAGLLLGSAKFRIAGFCEV